MEILSRHKVLRHKTSPMYGRIVCGDRQCRLFPKHIPDFYTQDATMEEIQSDYPELDFSDYELITINITKG